MCHPELKLPSVLTVAIRSLTVFVSAMTVVVVRARAIPAPTTPPMTNAARTTTHRLWRSARTFPPSHLETLAAPPQLLK
jgi:hypothetical protein